MCLRAGRLLIRLSVSVLVLVAASCAALAWQLSRAPVPLPYLAPRIETALAELVTGATAHVGRTELAWVHRRPALRVYDLALLDTDGSALAVLPVLAMRPSLGAALHGELAMAWIGLSGARLNLARTPDGRIIIDTREEDTTPSHGKTSKLLANLLSNRSQGGSAAYLRGIDVEDAAVDISDRAWNVTWTAADAQIGLRFHSSRIAARIEGVLQAQSDTSTFIRAVDLPLAVAMDATFRDGAVAELRFDLHTTHGHMASYVDPKTMIDIASIDARGDYSSETNAIQIHRLRAAVGPSRLEASARIPVGSDYPIQADGTLQTLAAVELPSFWPPTLQPKTRSWVAENIHGGTVSSCRFQLRVPRHHEGPLPETALNVTFEFNGLDVGFMKHFEPLHEVRGTATLTGARFISDIDSAASAGLNLNNGHLDIDLHAHPAQATIKAQVTGATADMLAVIDQPPLDIPRKLGIAPSAATGSGEVHLDLALPLAPETTSKDVRVLATADLRQTSHSDLRFGIGIRNADLHLDIDDGRVAIQGDTDVTNAPFVNGRIHANLVVSRPAPARSVSGSISGDDFSSEGTITLDDQGLRTVELTTLRFGGTDVAVDLARDPAGHCRVSLTGNVVDLEPLWNRPHEGDAGGSKVPWPSWDVDFVIRRVLTGRELELVNAEGRAHGEAARLDELHVTSTLAGGGIMQASFAPDESGDRPRFEVSTDEGGRFLKGLGVDLHLRGGSLTITGAIDRRASPQIVEGEMEMDDFRVVQAPILAQILSLGSLEGIADTVRREGIAFTRARVPFAWSQGDFEFRDARAVGAIGVTGTGAVGHDSGDLDISGQVIPAYTLNSALGKIPFIGNLLVGGEGQGIFGINYRVEGTRDNPDISVNPLSALAPGILRQMFIDPFTRKPASAIRDRAAAPAD